MKQTKYVLDVDQGGHRYWAAELPGGERDPLPSGWPLTLLSDKVDGNRDFPLPIGTRVLLEVPSAEESADYERGSIRRTLEQMVLAERMRRTGKAIDPDALRVIVDELVGGVG